MKRFATILICLFAVQTAFGQANETYKPMTTYKVAPLSTIMGGNLSPERVDYKNEIGVSVMNAFIWGYRNVYTDYLVPVGALYDMPFIEYEKSLYVYGEETMRYSFGLQYYHSIWKRFDVGVLMGFNSSYQNTYKRISGERVERYDHTNILIAPVIKWNYAEGRILKLYITAGVVANATYESTNDLTYKNNDVGGIALLGLSFGNRIAYFQEFGFAYNDLVINFGLGYRF